MRYEPRATSRSVSRLLEARSSKLAAKQLEIVPRIGTQGEQNYAEYIHGVRGE